MKRTILFILAALSCTALKAMPDIVFKSESSKAYPGILTATGEVEEEGPFVLIDKGVDLDSPSTFLITETQFAHIESGVIIRKGKVQSFLATQSILGHTQFRYEVKFENQEVHEFILTEMPNVFFDLTVFVLTEEINKKEMYSHTTSKISYGSVNISSYPYKPRELKMPPPKPYIKPKDNKPEFTNDVDIADLQDHKVAVQDEPEKVYGTVDVSINLNGRTRMGRLESPVYSAQEEGIVIVNITVDPQGNVINATVRPGTTISDPQMRNSSIDAAKRTKFNAIKSGENATGTITYRFKLK